MFKQLVYKTYCYQLDAARRERLKPSTVLKFEHHNRSMRVPFVIYADFESCIKPIDTCQPNPNDSYTNKYQKHIPMSFCIYVKCTDDSAYTRPPILYIARDEDDDVGHIFVDRLQEIVKDIYTQVKK